MCLFYAEPAQHKIDDTMMNIYKIPDIDEHIHTLEASLHAFTQTWMRMHEMVDTLDNDDRYRIQDAVAHAREQLFYFMEPTRRSDSVFNWMIDIVSAIIDWIKNTFAMAYANLPRFIEIVNIITQALMAIVSMVAAWHAITG